MMMNLCPKYIRKELLKMYPTITKFEAKELTKLRQKHRKTLPNHLKRSHENVVEHSPKSASPLKNQKKPMGMADAPPSFLMDSTTSPKVKTAEGERVRARSRFATLWGRGACWSSELGLGRLTSTSFTHTYLHKPNNELVSA